MVSVQTGIGCGESFASGLVLFRRRCGEGKVLGFMLELSNCGRLNFELELAPN